jgi:hypothetical protein
MKIWLVLWAVSISLPLTWMAAKHTGVLRSPGVERQFAATGSWRTIHVLMAGCGCSGRVADALRAARPAASGEEIWWVGEAAPEQALPVPVRRMDGPELLRTAGLTGGPALLIADPAGRIRYGGGYPEADAAGRNLAMAVRRGHAVPHRKIRGCAAKLARTEEH